MKGCNLDGSFREVKAQVLIPPNSNPQVLDCAGRTCPKCGGLLQPISDNAGNLYCGCPVCSRTVAGFKIGDRVEDLILRRAGIIISEPVEDFKRRKKRAFIAVQFDGEKEFDLISTSNLTLVREELPPDRPWEMTRVKLLNKRLAQPQDTSVGYHRHPNGGGSVADTADVADTAYVGSYAKVFGNAKVYDNAQVSGNAKVYDNAKVSGYAKISDDAKVYGNADVSDTAKVYGSAKVSDTAKVYGNAIVCGYAIVCGSAKVFDTAIVCSNAFVHGNAIVCGNAKVYDDTEVYGSAKVSDTAKVSGTVIVYDHAVVYGNAIVCGNARVRGYAEIYGNAKVYGNAIVCGNAKVYNRAEVWGDVVLTSGVYDEGVITKPIDDKPRETTNAIIKEKGPVFEDLKTVPRELIAQFDYRKKDFDIGDTVEVVNEESKFFGQKGKIISFDSLNLNEAMIEWEDVKGSPGDYVDLSDIEKVVPAESSPFSPLTEEIQIEEQEGLREAQKKESKIVRAIMRKLAPFKSPKQEAWMQINEPEIAKKWVSEHGHAKGYKEYLKKRKKKGELTQEDINDVDRFNPVPSGTEQDKLSQESFINSDAHTVDCPYCGERFELENWRIPRRNEALPEGLSPQQKGVEERTPNLPSAS